MVEEAGKRLKGCIWERSKGFTSWVRLGDFSLQYLLSRVEVCVKEHRNGGWSMVRRKKEKSTGWSVVQIKQVLSFFS